MVAPFEIRPFNEVLGAEVVGFDMRVPLADAEFAKISHAFDRHSVLVFRDQQQLDPAAHIAFSRRFGHLEIHVQKKFLLEGHPELLIVSNEFRDGEPIGLVDAGKYWHSDLSYKPEPSMGSLLHSRTLPASGGDTLFATQHAAYDALPAAMQKRLDPLKAEHSYLARNAAQRAKSTLRPDLTDAEKQTVLPAVHPVVRVHPGTGRNALFVSEGFTTHIEGLPEDESRDLLAEIYAHQTQDQFIYRHHWIDGDLVMWDNRAVMHLATGCPPELARTLYRTTIRGPVPVGPVQ